MVLPESANSGDTTESVKYNMQWKKRKKVAEKALTSILATGFGTDWKLQGSY